MILLQYRPEGGVAAQERERSANFGEFSGQVLRQFGSDLLPDWMQGIDLGAILSAMNLCHEGLLISCRIWLAA